MNELSQDILLRVEEYAGLFLFPEEIAVMIEIPYDDFARLLKNKKSPAYLAYMKGKTTSKMQIRKNIISMARNGSPQAEMLAGKFISDQAIAETEL